jgi:hypothetical protein
VSEGGTRRTPSAWVLTACGVWLVGLGLYFAVLRPPLLPEDARFMGTSAARLHEAAPGIERWLRLVFTVMGGFMAGTGVLTLFLAAQPPARGRSWATVLAGLATVAVMSAVNFTLGSDFRWLLLVPVLAWIGAFVLQRSGR